MNQAETSLGGRGGGVKNEQFSLPHPRKGKFISNLFLVRKKNADHRPVINLKILNRISFIPSFQDGRSKRIKYILQRNDYMCKIDLKDVYFSIPLHIGRKPVPIVVSSF